MSKLISLINNKFAIVDDKDYDCLITTKWRALLSKAKYYYAVDRNNNKMHRLIMNAPTAMDVDHINGNTLDNRKFNLRVVTRSENCRNRNNRLSQLNTSGTRGVTYYAPENRWRVRGTLNGQRFHLGYFKTYDEAVARRDAFENKYWLGAD